MRYFLFISYNGRSYHGWQRQLNSITIQEVIENALSEIFKDNISIIGAGRTDTGVHAKLMVAHFDLKNSIVDYHQTVYRLNQFLPKDIFIQSVKKVKDHAHARFDAISRTYEYHITNKKDVFYNEFKYFINNPLKMDLLIKALSILKKNNNFKCFSKTNTDVSNYICTIKIVKWKETENGYIFTITANRFLRNMVRAIVGTLIDVGSEKKSIDDFNNIIKSKNRSKAGFSVPAHALFLTKIDYPKKTFI